MRKMNDCFALRFNLQKCGYTFPDNSKVFAEMFDENENFIKETLEQYRDALAAYSKKIADESDLTDLNARLSGKRILFMGDSITSERLSYGKIIAKTVSCECFDEAVSGSHSLNVLKSIKDTLKKHAPDIVIIMIGTNDSQCVDIDGGSPSVSEAEYERNIRLTAKIAAEYPARLIFITVPHVHSGKISSFTADCVDKCNAVLKQISEECRFELINTQSIFTQFSDDILFEPDGIHLSPFAQCELAKKVLLYLK